MSTEMVSHLLQSFAFEAGVTLHVDWIWGENNHHMYVTPRPEVSITLKLTEQCRVRLQGIGSRHPNGHYPDRWGRRTVYQGCFGVVNAWA